MSGLNGVRPRGLTHLLLILSFSKVIAAEPLRIDGSTGVKPLVSALANEYQSAQPGAVVDIGKGLKPNARINALLDKTIDIAMASHGIEADDITAKGLKVHRFAQMAVVIGVNQSVGVSSLSHEALCGIYSGTLTSWKNVGGADVDIVPFLRPFDEVDTEVLVKHIPCFAKLQVPAHIQTKKKSGQMARALANTPGAVGMTTLVRVAQSDGKIRAIALNNVKPDPTKLLSGAYPLTRDSFLITAAKPSAKVAAFLAFVRSEKGANIILANNAVPAG